MKQWLKKYWWLPLCILFPIILPVLVNTAFLQLHFNTGAELNNATWLGFWGSYLGGLLSSVAALIALYLTYRQQDQHHKEQSEYDRLSHLPVFSCPLTVPSETNTCVNWIIINEDGSMQSEISPTPSKLPGCYPQNDSHYKLIFLTIKNIGSGPALDVKFSADFSEGPQLHPFSALNNFGIGQSEEYKVMFPNKSDVEFNILFSDVFCNEYRQTFTLIYVDTNIVDISDASPPVQKAKA